MRNSPAGPDSVVVIGVLPPGRKSCTFAPGIAAPDGSTTVPESPPRACANALEATNRHNNPSNVSRRILIFPLIRGGHPWTFSENILAFWKRIWRAVGVKRSMQKVKFEVPL